MARLTIRRIPAPSLSLAMLSLVLPVVLQLALPAAGHAAARDLYVSSSQTHSVKRFDGETGLFLGNFIARADGGLNNTQECIFGVGGDAYVVGFGNSQVLRFDGTSGAFIGPFSSGYALSNPSKAIYGPDGHFYVSQWGGAKKVVKFDAFTGVYLGDVTNVAVDGGMGHAWDAAGNLYLAAWGANGNDGDVYRFDPAGNLLGSFTEAGILLGPVNLWFDDDGDLLVQDWTQGTIERFDGVTGLWQSTYVSGMTRTEGWVYDTDGMLYACDWLQNVVNRYEADGTFDAVFASGANLNNPNDVTFGPEPPVATPLPIASAAEALLHANSPNPFAASTRIRFTLPQAGQVDVSIVDVSGRLVERLTHGTLPAGDHSVAWSAGSRASGVYYYRLQTAGSVETARMVLAR